MIAYALATYGGKRRVITDPRRTVQAHIGSLEITPHRTAEEFIIAPKVEGDIFADMRSDDFVMTLLQPPNRAWSYGSYFAVAKETDCEYIICVEDDYHFPLPHFDSVLLTLLEREGPDCGLLCGLYAHGHACVSCGIARTEALRKAADIFPWDAHSSHRTPGEGGHCCQLAHSQAIKDAGYRIADWTQHYRTVATLWSPDRHLQEWGPPDAPILLAPLPDGNEYP